MFAQLFGCRRQRAFHPEDNAAGAPEQPPTKKIKTGHSEEEQVEEVAAASGSDPDNAAVLAVLMGPSFLEEIASFLDFDSELQLAACRSDLFVFFASRAMRTLFNNVMPEKPDERGVFLHRLTSAIDALPEGQCILTNNNPSFWTSIWSWLRGRPRRPPSRLEPWRFYLHHAYKVPVIRENAFRFGPSCSSSLSSSRPSDEQRLFCLTGGDSNNGGIVVTLAMPGATSEIISLEHTRQSDPGIFPCYNFIMDKLWFCPSPNNNKGFLILKHQANFSQDGGTSVRVLDLSQTNQDVGLGASETGIDQRRITPSQAFCDAFSKEAVVVSEHDALVFFIADRNGTIGIESYDVTTRRLVASTRKKVGAVGPESPENLLTAMNSLYPRTQSVVTGDKLVMIYHTEREVLGEVNDYGFGVYVWNCRDLSFCNYVPMFGNTEVILSTITKDWIVYDIPGTPGYFLLPIAGGNVGQARQTNLDPNVVLATENHVYTYNPDEREGNIEIDQFDVLTGNKIRTLETGIPWMVDDAATGHRLHRMMASAHVVGNKVVFLISSVGSHINTIVAFALPPQ